MEFRDIVGTVWEIGDTINLHGGWLMFSPTNLTKQRGKDADATIPDNPRVTPRSVQFDSFLPVDRAIDVDGTEVSVPDGATSYIEANVPSDKQGQDPIGIKLASGTGTVANPYKFELEYAPEPDTYPVWVGATQVTKDNRTDVLGDGKVVFDPNTNTLTLDDQVIEEMYKSEQGWTACIHEQGLG